MADVPHAPFWVGELVRVFPNESNGNLRPGIVLEVFWDPRRGGYVYRLERDGERRPELYFEEDLASTTWLDWDNPQAMLDHLKAKGKPSERKLRLFACCCCRRIWGLLPGPRPRRAIEVTEMAVDGIVAVGERLASAHEALGRLGEMQGERGYRRVNYMPMTAEYAGNAAYWAAAHDAVNAGTVAEQSEKAAGGNAEQAWQSSVLIDLFGPDPFRSRPSVDSSLLAWNGAAVVRLAQAAYDERILPQGTLDNARLLILADALEEAGSTDAGLLRHLRSGRGHWRGCWALDALLGKE